MEFIDLEIGRPKGKYKYNLTWLATTEMNYVHIWIIGKTLF